MLRTARTPRCDDLAHFQSTIVLYYGDYFHWCTIQTASESNGWIDMKEFSCATTDCNDCRLRFKKGARGENSQINWNGLLRSRGKFVLYLFYETALVLETGNRLCSYQFLHKTVNVFLKAWQNTRSWISAQNLGFRTHVAQNMSEREFFVCPTWLRNWYEQIIPTIQWASILW